MRSREEDLVELVDENGAPCGKATVAHAHTSPGIRHRAFSVHLLDAQGRLLLQQRAAVKTRFALRWANATCGHPGPGEDLVTAASRRLAEEIGVRGVALTEIGVYAYRAVDPSTDRVEDEYDHVLLGILGPGAELPRPDPTEVAALRWVHPADLLGWLDERPDDFAPWLAGVTAVAVPALGEVS
ncbi:isopentenyl-diphosphate Delta-isomerase [Catellatospora vulcania]|uniref:isopentenyl-diphosphate Delta-isomerase n=1 Tax=Catellatospora vulcania TaxID=1460450 RepID=UPI0012D3E073|nr:isopentenyl-diphosphate Delta-isomerase [Catellatospora vulcania]